VPRKTDEVDVLNELCAQGWELVSILDNHVTYLVAETTASGAPRRRGGPLARSDGRARDRSARNGPVGLLGLMGEFQPQTGPGRLGWLYVPNKSGRARPLAWTLSKPLPQPEDRRRRLAAAAPARFLWGHQAAVSTP
jgi:hypothetical protein